MSRFSIYLVFICSLIGGCSEPESASQEALQRWVGADFSKIEVQTLDGQLQPLRDVAGGKPIVLNVWATWCTPCLREMPTLDALGRGGEFTVVAIATDATAQVVKDFLRGQTWGQGVQIWFDPLGAVTRREMGALAIPVTYVLDPSLTVQMVEVGERDWGHSAMIGRVREVLRAD